jgi:hypothetical protein
LRHQRHPISHVKVAQLRHDQHYSLQGNRKTEEGDDHPDRNAQFRHINATVKKAPPRACRSSRSIPRRKNSWARIRIPASSGARRAIPST